MREVGVNTANMTFTTVNSVQYQTLCFRRTLSLLQEKKRRLKGQYFFPASFGNSFLGVPLRAEKTDSLLVPALLLDFKYL